MHYRPVMHVDMDAFFASIEQRDHPEYRGRPVIVGAQPGRRGVVATCSYEARAFGVRSALPISEAYRRCPQGIYLRPNLARYAAVSGEVLALLHEVSPVVEPVSIDEAFVDLSGLGRLFGEPEAIGSRTKHLIEERLGLSASIGIGPNRLIAKLASDAHKPDGLTVVPPEDVPAFLWPMPVSRLRGVGEKTGQVLERLGIGNVQALQATPLETLQTHLGTKGALHLYRQAQGIASDVVGQERARKSLSKETTFEEDIDEEGVLRDTLRWLAAEVGHIARHEGLRGRVVTLKLRLRGFQTHTRQCSLAEATNRDRDLFQNAWSLYRGSGYTGRPVRLLGIGLTGWDASSRSPFDLFGQPRAAEREERLYTTLDRVSARFGRGALRFGLPRKPQRGA